MVVDSVPESIKEADFVILCGYFQCMKLWKENDIVIKMGWDAHASGWHSTPDRWIRDVGAVCKVKTMKTRRNVL